MVLEGVVGVGYSFTHVIYAAPEDAPRATPTTDAWRKLWRELQGAHVRLTVEVLD